jgi:alpha-tubulin suppressor-like RCC1 family protein
MQPRLLLVVSSAILAACAGASPEEPSRGEAALETAAEEAGLVEGSAEAKGVLAVVNDRRLDLDAYVLKVRLRRATAAAILGTRDGINGENESRLEGDDPSPTAAWTLGGDDESFDKVAEIDALPGTDASAFRRLLEYARANGYVRTPALELQLVGVGDYHACKVNSSGKLSCWGSNEDGQSRPPAGRYQFQIPSTNSFHSCALRSDGTVACWGSGTFGQTEAPEGVFRTVSAGTVQSCGIRMNGTVACWGPDWFEQITPSGVFRDIASANATTCGIGPEGSISCWGNNAGLLHPPSGAFDEIAAKYNFACAIRSNTRTLACWGENQLGQATPPPGRFGEVAAGTFHACGVRDDGTIACWGANEDGESTPPAGKFRQVAVASGRSCAVREDSTIVCWGRDAIDNP